MSKIVKSLLASAVIFSSTALPATAANINKSSKIISGEYKVSQLSNDAGELVANGANHES